MLATLLWLVGSVLLANLILAALKFVVFALLLNRSDFHDPISAEERGLKPLTSLPGVAAELPENYWRSVPGAHARLRKYLGVLGGIFAFLSVSLSYMALNLVIKTGKPPYWCLLAFPFNSFVLLGARGLRTDFRLIGPVQAIFMQLFYSSFTSFSLLAVVLILILRM